MHGASRQVGLLRALLYVGAQCAGAAAGAALLAILVPAGALYTNMWTPSPR